MRAELSQSAFEQKDYLRKVERARVMRDKEQRRKARETKAGMAGTIPPTEEKRKANESFAKERTFKQREGVVRDVREKRDRGGEATPAAAKRAKTSHEIANDDALQGALAKIF